MEDIDPVAVMGTVEEHLGNLVGLLGEGLDNLLVLIGELLGSLLVQPMEHRGMLAVLDMQLEREGINLEVPKEDIVPMVPLDMPATEVELHKLEVQQDMVMFVVLQDNPLAAHIEELFPSIPTIEQQQHELLNSEQPLGIIIGLVAITINFTEPS